MPPVTSSQISEYDLKKFKQFIAGNSLSKLKDQSGILVVGEMGAGKSTAIAIQLGAIYKFDEKDQTDPYKLVSSGTYTPKTSSGYTSTTLNIGAYPDVKNRLLYLDTAGLNENRGKEEKLWTSNNIGLLFSTVKEFKAIVVVIDYAKTFSGRDDGIRALAAGLSKVTMRDDKFYDSMVFVMSNGYNYGRKINIDLIVTNAGRMLVDFQRREKKLVASLNERHPIKTSLAGRALRGAIGVASAVNPYEEEPDYRFDINDVSPEDMEDLRFLQDSQKLLKTIRMDEGNRIILSYPDGEKECQRIRTDLQRKINATPSITRSALKAIKEKNISDTSLLFFNVLSSLVSSYLSDLSKEAALLEQLITYYKKETETLRAIEHDWEGARDLLVKTKISEITSKGRIIENKQTEIDKLERSIEPTVLDEQHILKERDGGFWGVKYLWGNSKAKETYEYAAGQTFVGYKYVDSTGKDFGADVHFSPEVKDPDPSKKTLKIEFTSENGYNLNLKVRVSVYEKDHPATKDRVRNLRNDNAEMELQVLALEKSVLALNSAKNKEQVYEEVTKEKKAHADELEEIMTSFGERLSEDEEETEWHTIKGVESLFILLRDLNIIHPELSEANHKIINVFLEKCAIIKTAGKNEHFERILPDMAKSAQYKHEAANKEAIAPVIESNFFNQLSGGLNTSMRAIKLQDFNFVEKHQFELGCCAVLLGSLLWSKSAGSNVSYSSMMLITTGVFAALSYVRTSIEKIATDIGRVTHSNNRRFLAMIEETNREMITEAKKANTSVSETGMFAIRKLTEKVNLDLKADIKNLPGSNSVFSVSGFKVF